MNAPKPISKDSLKELYNDSKKRIKVILQHLARLNKDNQLTVSIDEQTIKMMEDLCLQIISSAKLEGDNQYRNAIIHIADWMSSALQKNYIEQNQGKYPNPLFVVKKGAEILHSFLHRDLRRKQFSSEENEIYQNYLVFTRKLTNPKTST